MAKIVTVSRKGHHPIETLVQWMVTSAELHDLPAARAN